MILEAIRVVDWTAYHQGSVAGCMLADLGAEVIKVEALDTGDPGRGIGSISGVDLGLPNGGTAYFEICNRNKKGLAVDLRKPEGKNILHRLIERSDVLLQNFRPGVAERLGLDYETLRERNPRLVYAHGSGHGSLGPDGGRPSLDFTGCARASIHDALYLLESEEPWNPPTGVADHGAATMLAYGVMAALFARERFGIGQKVDSSLMSSMLWLQSLEINTYLLLGTRLPRVLHDNATNPLVNSYRAKDGRWMVIDLAPFDRFWCEFCGAVGRPDLEQDSRFSSGERAVEHHRALIAELEAVFATRTSWEWTELFRKRPDFVWEAVSTVADIQDDPQVQANNYTVDFAHPTLGQIKTLNAPISFSETPWSIRLPALEFGQHTEEILTEICGYSWEEVIAFREAGAI